MSIKDIKQYIDWCLEGFSSLPQRYDLMLQRKKEVEAQIADLQSMLSTIHYKLNFYKKALETGNDNPCEEEQKIWAKMILDEKNF